jgi:hypothetical protein
MKARRRLWHDAGSAGQQFLDLAIRTGHSVASRVNGTMILSSDLIGIDHDPRNFWLVELGHDALESSARFGIT